MANNTSKKIHFLRAIQNNKPVDLEALINRARKKNNTVELSEVPFARGEILRIQKTKAKSKIGRFLHVVRYYPGEKASTLIPKSKKEEDKEGSQKATKGTEFKDGDSFLLVSKHNIVFCSHGVSLKKTEQYIGYLLAKSGVRPEDREFKLSPASNIDELKMLNEQGVRSITLTTNAYQTSIPENQRTSWYSKPLGSCSDVLSAMFLKDSNIEDLKAMEDLVVKLEVNLKGNIQAAESAKEQLMSAAEDVLDEETHLTTFSIRTQHGETITPDKIQLNTIVNVRKQDNSIYCIDIWDCLENYLGELTHSNLLEI